MELQSLLELRTKSYHVLPAFTDCLSRENLSLFTVTDFRVIALNIIQYIKKIVASRLPDILETTRYT